MSIPYMNRSLDLDIIFKVMNDSRKSCMSLWRSYALDKTIPLDEEMRKEMDRIVSSYNKNLSENQISELYGLVTGYFSAYIFSRHDANFERFAYTCPRPKD